MAGRSSIPTAAGPPVETYELDSGIHVPFGALRYLDDAGTPADVTPSTPLPVALDTPASAWPVHPRYTDAGATERAVSAAFPFPTRRHPVDVLTSKDLTSAVQTGNPAAPGTGEHIVAVDGYATAAFRLSTGWTGTVQFEVSFNNGALWDALMTARGDASAAPVTNTTTAGSWYDAVIPAGATHIRARVSTFTTGPVTVRIGLSAAAYDPAPAGSWLTSANQTTSARQGLGAVSGVWQDLSSTALGAAATFTGASMDLANAASSAVLGATHYAQELRISAESDVAGTLYLEASRDNTTWRRIRRAVAAQDGGDASMGYYAELVWRPSWRYARAVYVNGAAAQARFACESYRMAG